MNSVEAIGLTKDFGAFRALNDVSFQIGQGETVGIIGSNGAGKSTLLQILSQVIRPSFGRVEMVGRVASILEVGTGFHPDLSGRENVYMNGNLLGLSKKEIDGLFDEIVAFSEIEDFIDGPVKHYSSGMYLRLAFSVFTHLSADIILLDEVMGVGDTAFRRKCERKILGLSNSGATVVMVNHDMASISKVCDRCILLEKGRLVADDLTDEVIQKYFIDSNVVRRFVPEMSAIGWPTLASRSDGTLDIGKIICTAYENGELTEVVQMSSTIKVDIHLSKNDSSEDTTLILRLDNGMGNPVFADSMDFRPIAEKGLKSQGQYVVSVEIPGNFLNDGVYYISLVTGRNQYQPEFFEQLVKFNVEKPAYEIKGNWDFKNLSIRPHLNWTVSRRENS